MPKRYSFTIVYNSKACLQGIPIHVKSVAGETALHFASKNNHLTLIPILLDHKAEIDITDGRGMTPLMAAAQNGHYDRPGLEIFFRLDY